MVQGSRLVSLNCSVWKEVKQCWKSRSWDLPRGLEVLDKGWIVGAERVGEPVRLVGEV